MPVPVRPAANALQDLAELDQPAVPAVPPAPLTPQPAKAAGGPQGQLNMLPFLALRLFVFSFVQDSFVSFYFFIFTCLVLIYSVYQLLYVHSSTSTNW